MKRKILFLIPTLENGGAEKVLINLVNNMDYEKYDITVQTLFDVGVHKERINKSVRYCSFLKKPFHGYTDIISLMPRKLLYERIIKERYDIAISYLEGSCAKVISGCPYANTKKIAWIHTVMDTKKRLCIGFVRKHQALKVYNSFDRIVFVSDSAKTAFQKTSNRRLLSDIVIYNTNEFDRIVELSREPVEDTKINHDTFNICSVGKITPNKGFDRMAHILKKMREEKVNVHVYAIGTGEQRDEIEDYLKKNNLEKHFSFLGYKENPYKYVASCDLYVCASHREGFSTAVTEALIVGTPVVSTNCSGAEELLGVNNEYGIVTENSIEALYKGIMGMATDKDLYQHYKKQASRRGTAFSTEKTVNAVETLLEEVLDE